MRNSFVNKIRVCCDSLSPKYIASEPWACLHSRPGPTASPFPLPSSARTVLDEKDRQSEKLLASHYGLLGWPGSGQLLKWVTRSCRITEAAPRSIQVYYHRPSWMKRDNTQESLGVPWYPWELLPGSLLDIKMCEAHIPCSSYTVTYFTDENTEALGD